EFQEKNEKYVATKEFAKLFEKTWNEYKNKDWFASQDYDIGENLAKEFLAYYNHPQYKKERQERLNRVDLETCIWRKKIPRAIGSSTTDISETWIVPKYINIKLIDYKEDRGLRLGWTKEDNEPARKEDNFFSLKTPDKQERIKVQSNPNLEQNLKNADSKRKTLDEKEVPKKIKEITDIRNGEIYPIITANNANQFVIYEPSYFSTNQKIYVVDVTDGNIISQNIRQLDPAKNDKDLDIILKINPSFMVGEIKDNQFVKQNYNEIFNKEKYIKIIGEKILKFEKIFGKESKTEGQQQPYKTIEDVIDKALIEKLKTAKQDMPKDTQFVSLAGTTPTYYRIKKNQETPIVQFYNGTYWENSTKNIKSENDFVDYQIYSLNGIYSDKELKKESANTLKQNLTGTGFELAEAIPAIEIDDTNPRNYTVTYTIKDHADIKISYIKNTKGEIEKYIRNFEIQDPYSSEDIKEIINLCIQKDAEEKFVKTAQEFYNICFEGTNYTLGKQKTITMLPDGLTGDSISFELLEKEKQTPISIQYSNSEPPFFIIRKQGKPESDAIIIKNANNVKTWIAKTHPAPAEPVPPESPVSPTN
ncbi:MAG: hypothetical protein WC806_06420, partial [Candidatus Gracilibacteria bacterium]